MNLTKYEMETIIRFNEQDEDAVILTYNAALMKALDKYIGSQGANSPVSLSYRTEEPEMAAYNVPKHWIKVAPKFKRQISEERRRALSEQMKERNAKT